MKVLIACEYSGSVREAFKSKGFDAWSCDLLDTEIPGNHYKGNIEDILYDKWDLIIAHPPCTYICNSGVCHLYLEDGKTNKERWNKLIKAANFFKLFVNHPCEKICIENPIPHKYGLKMIGKKYSQIIHPWQFGHKEQKATCLWLKGLPKLKVTNNVYNEMMELPNNERQRLHYLAPSEERAKLRSKTFEGIARAMADQWSKPFYVQKEMFI